MKLRTFILSGVVSLFLAGLASAKILNYISTASDGRYYTETLQLNTENHIFLMNAVCTNGVNPIGGGEFKGLYAEHGNILILKESATYFFDRNKEVTVVARFEKLPNGSLRELKPYPHFEDLMTLQSASCSLRLDDYYAPLIFTPQN